MYIVCIRNCKSLIYIDMEVALRSFLWLKKRCLLCHMKDVVLHYSILFQWNKIVRVQVETMMVQFTDAISLSVIRVQCVKDRAHLSTFKFFILEKFSCIVVLIVFFVIVQSSGLTSVWFREKMTFINDIYGWGLLGAAGRLQVNCS